MDNPASCGDGTSGSVCRRITKYGTTKYDLVEVSHRFREDGPGHGTYRTDESCRNNNLPCKFFFAAGNCRRGNFCHFSHNDQTRDSFNRHIPDYWTQGMDSRVNVAPEGSKRSGTALNFNMPSRNGDQNEMIAEYDPVTDSLDLVTSVIREEQAKLASRKPDVLDTVGSEAAASGKSLTTEEITCIWARLLKEGKLRSEQILDLTHIKARFPEEEKRFPELYAALSATNALGFTQSSVSGSAGPDVPALSSRQYDPVTDSLERIKSVISVKQVEVALSSELPRAGDPGGVGLYGTDYEDVEPNVNNHQSVEKDLFDDCDDEEQCISMAEETKEGNSGIEEQNISKAEDIKEGKDRGKSANNEGDGKTGEGKGIIDRKNLRAFKLALAELVKELLSPSWNGGQINKESYKTIVKKAVSKVIASVPSIIIPETKEKIDNYISASKPKILKLVQAYIEIVKKEKADGA